MQPSDAKWYEALQGNPLNMPTFTYDLKARIRSKALSSTVQSKSRMKHYIIISASMICMLGLILFAVDIPTSSVVTIEHRELSQPPADSKWQEWIDRKYPESHNEILYKMNISEDKILIFTKKLFELKGFQSFSLTTDTFVWESQQWKERESFSMSIGDPRREGTREKLITMFAGNPTIFNGVIIDPQIASVQVVVNQNITQQAQLITIGDGYLYWFIAMTESDAYRDIYRVDGLDAEGKVLTSEVYYNH